MVASGDGTSLADVPVGDGQAIVCTITNTRETGTLQVLKEIEGPSGTDSFDLFIEADQVADDAGDGEGSDAEEVNTGTYTVSETAGTGTSLDNYGSSITCRVGADIVAGPTAGTTIEAPVGDGQAVVCTITNTREAGTLQVLKEIEGPSGTDSFDLFIEADLVADDAGDGEGSAAVGVVTGIHTVSETAGTGTSLDNYGSSITCRVGADIVAGPTAGTTIEAPVGDGEDVVCTITNTRETGRLSVVKQIEGDSDDDSFDLYIESDLVADDAGDGDGSTPASFATGTYTVSEQAGTDTDLDNYTSGINCVDEADGNTVVASGSGTTLEVPVGTDQAIVCTISNTRETGRLTVIKQLEPADDLGLFNLLINGEAGATDVGDEGSIPAQVVNTGVYTLTETAGTDTELDDYTRSLECRDAADTIVPSLNGQVTIGNGDAIVCTFTNVAKPQAGTIIVKKVADEYDTGKDFPFSSDFDGNANDGTDFSLEAGKTQEFVLLAGTYSVKELVPTGWELVSAVCSDQSPVTAIVLAAEEIITCTFTNEKDSYEQYPGDDDFDFVPPFVDPDPVPADPDPAAVVAGNNEVPSVQPAPQAVSPEAVSPPQPAEPIALEQLPRTGNGLDRVTMFGGLMLLAGGMAVMTGRRRKAHKA